MELYFNPYPGAAQSREAGAQNVVAVADALHRLKSEMGDALSGATMEGDFRMGEFILVRESGVSFKINDIIHLANNIEREKIKLLLTLFSRGKIIELNEMPEIENWILKNIGTTAPVLEMATKESGMALTVADETEWRVDVIEFEGQREILHNLWGQRDLSSLKDHCVNSIKNVKERFLIRFDATFCNGAPASAPEDYLWESYGFFSEMDKARKREFEVDKHLIKNVGNTKHGILRELRCYGDGWRIFFAFRKDRSPKVLVGGFYNKSAKASQDAAIQEAIQRVNSF